MPPFLLICLCATALSAAELLDFDLTQQGDFVRENQGWTTTRSDGDLLLRKWAFGAWDAETRFRISLGRDADQAPHLVLEHLAGTPALMLFRPDAAAAKAGETLRCTFEYRMPAGGNGECLLRLGEAQTERVTLGAQTGWTPATVQLTAAADGMITVDWRLLAEAGKPLHLRKASLRRVTTRRAEVALPAVSAVRGALVDERYVVELHVAPAYDDARPGTDAAQPLRTLGAALSKALPELAAGRATRIRLAAGTYREAPGAIDFPTGRDTLLAIEGAAPEQVVFSGADPLTVTADPATGLLHAPWPHRFGNSYYDWPAGAVGHRCEMVWLEGQPLVQRILETHAPDGNRLGAYTALLDPVRELTPGSFGVAERAENGERLSIRPPAGAPSAARYEASVRHTCLAFGPKRGLVLRNLVFAHFANRRVFPWHTELPVSFDAATEDLLIEDCAFRWNNAGGLHLGEADNHGERFRRVTVRRCRLDRNGFGGGGTGRMHDVLIEDCTSDGNGWRGLWCGDTGWAHAGIKFHTNGAMILRRHRAIGNIGQGIWFDVHCEDTLVEDLVSVLNLGDGLFTEISGGPFLIRRCLLAHNRGKQYAYYTVGDCTVEDTILAGSSAFHEKDGGLARFRWYPRPGNGHWEQFPFDPGHLVMRRTVTWSDGTTQLWNFSNNPSAMPTFLDIYRGEGNRWWAPADGPRRFVFGDWDDAAFGDFTAWRRYVGDRERDPTWGDPGFADAARLDFTLTPGSPLQPRATDLRLERFTRAQVAEVEALWRWAGVKDDASLGALTPPR